MKAVVALLIFASLLYKAQCACWSCAYGTPKEYCTNVYYAVGPEADICKTTDPDLCHKYKGPYSIFCEEGTATYTCQNRDICKGYPTGIPPTLAESASGTFRVAFATLALCIATVLIM